MVGRGAATVSDQVRGNRVPKTVGMLSEAARDRGMSPELGPLATRASARLEPEAVENVLVFGDDLLAGEAHFLQTVLVPALVLSSFLCLLS